MIYTDRFRKNSLVMVVDDDPSLRMVISAALKKFGFDVIDAEGGRQGVELFETEKPDIVLLDVMMPDIDGFAACEMIKQSPAGKYTQILMVTGLEDVDSIKKAFEVGADGFVTKPLNFTMLGQQVLYMLRAGHAFKEMHINRSRLAKTQELARIGNWQVDLRTNEFQCSQEAGQLLGLDLKNENISLDDFLGPVVESDIIRVKESLNLALDNRKSANLEYQIHYTAGTRKSIVNKSEIIFDEQDRPVLMLGVVQDISQLKKAEEEIRFLAFYDSLTGLANRMLFMDRLDQVIKNSTRKKKHFALLFLDLDNFKRINDLLGHHIGDLLLKKVADNIKKSIRSSDSATRMSDRAGQKEPVIARLGGDEFTILAADIDGPESAAMIARRLLGNVPEVYNFEGHDVSVTTSIGISVFPEDGDKADLLLKNADTAMYHAKNEGKNTYQFFTESMNQAVLERFSIDRDLRKALQRNELVVHYQPQIDLSNRKIVGAEALIRWHHSHKGMVPPDKFIPIAEETGIIIDINKWVFGEACRQAEQWILEDFHPITVAVNLSGYRLASQNIIQSIESALFQTQIDASHIEIEVTENILIQDTDETVSTLNKIKDLNLRIAMDDFGTGYSSLSYLTTFPVDTIKIDRSFVMGCTSQSNNLVVIKAIIAMGHSLGKKIVAEGIETEEQYYLLKELGCEEAQGYYFSHPVPPQEFARLLANGAL